MTAIVLFRIQFLFSLLVVGACSGIINGQEPPSLFDPSLFDQHIAPLLERHCVECHNAERKEGGLALDSRTGLLAGGESGVVIDEAEPAKSPLLKAILPDGNERPAMPKGRPALISADIKRIEQWFQQKTPWPEDRRLKAQEHSTDKWWSLQPLVEPQIPVALPVALLANKQTGDAISSDYQGNRDPANLIDAFIDQQLQARGLAAAPRATRRELIRRLAIDLTGLIPTFDEIQAFEQDSRPDSYERLVDRLLASPAYGERWARHWLDVVHYGETHGYDKDKLRMNAWPYRDYVISAFNNDKPYGDFVREQIAGDVLCPNHPDAIEAVGFLSAGPWDFIGHAEVPESKLDGRIARHLDRDDMVQNTFLTFQSLTIGCAQCHAHKFDPISQAEYYGLQSVFAALDRADRKYYRDPALQARFATLENRQRELEQRDSKVRGLIAQSGGEELAKIDKLIAAARSATPQYPPEHGYHSAIATQADATKWVQIDLGSSQTIYALEWIACHDDFAGIGDGFGAPLRWKIEAADDARFESGVTILWDHTASDLLKPGIRKQSKPVDKVQARYVRFTATRLAERKDDYIFALAELRVLNAAGENLALGKSIESRDSIEAPVRWSRSNLVDDKYPRAADAQSKQLAELESESRALLNRLVSPELLEEQHQIRNSLTETKSDIARLPAPSIAYVATIHYGQGTFTGTGASGGRPREVRVLPRGDVSKSGPLAAPCSLSCLTELKSDLAAIDSSDRERRAALAHWLSDRRNPLTWRSIVNRLWSYHFQRGLVETPNDFGRMGGLPSHPELLDCLAIELREHQSLKQLQRQIVLSVAYQRTSRVDGQVVDADPNNRSLARSPRRRLEAEAVRDCMLSVAGLLRREMGGPSFQDFVIEHPEHSPHYEYAKHDPRDPSSMRRSIYRFLARSQTQPLMTSLDCADPSMQVDVRSESNSATQSLSLLNNAFTLMIAEEWADRVEREQQPRDRSQLVREMFASALGRWPTSEEANLLNQLASEHGLTTVARVLFNMNEFLYVD